MKPVYELYKGKEIKANNYSGIIVGYNQEYIILATRDTPTAAFKKLDKTSYVDPEYKHEMWNYVYGSESYIEKYLKDAENN